ncbi:uncharacterized protein LOC126576920 [Anopheles aquasalis]|uniref:uncharacterized protein LOC126576920 n=1 Tax=Anopheles aquasalis TaxID=42839 RepID=UPI00215A509B|nr:uncharacterized protein LOC126576920 [Anopheles aquasalis]
MISIGRRIHGTAGLFFIVSLTVATVAVAVALPAPAQESVKVENAVPVDSSAILETALCLMKSNPGQCVRQQAARVLGNWEDILNTKKMEILAEADKEVTSRQQSRGLSDAEVARGKPSTLMEQIETGLGVLSDFVSEGVDEYVSDEEKVKAGDEATSKTHIHHLLHKLGKHKHKKKKTFMKLFIIGAALKAKIELLLKILSFKLQLKFFAVALIGLLINIARFWLDFKKQPSPQKVIYYEHAQHQHHYDDHGDDFGGYWQRSLHGVHDDEPYQRQDELNAYRNPKLAQSVPHHAAASRLGDPHALAYQQQRPY